MANTTREITFQNFESTVDSNPIVILDFWAAWCGPCRMFAPTFEKAAEDHPDIVFGKVNTETAQDLAGAFRVRSIPTIMAFKEGVLLFEQAGVLPAQALNELVQKLREVDMKEVKAQMAAAEAGNGEP
ncbi:MAG: thioredoxin [Bdellovibrionales bacterium]|nr:thioredoxin [Bdellovibrionales bacterium]